MAAALERLARPADRPEGAAPRRPVPRAPRTPAPVLGLILPVGLALVWELAAAQGWIALRLLPPPTAILAQLHELALTGELGRHLEATLRRVALGFALGVGAATLTGAATGTFEPLRRLLDPTIQALRAVPSIAWVPLFALWFGIFETPKVLLIAVGAFFPVYLTLEAGIRGVDRKLVEVGRVYHLEPLSMIGRILLPAALPAWLTGVRGGLGLAWMFVIAAELMGASEGLGYLLIDGQRSGNAAIILGALLLFAVLGKTSDALLVASTRRLVAWQDSQGRRLRTMLELEGVAKRYPNGHLALDSLDLALPAGRITVVISPSGCGKSTLLRLVAGLEAPTAGRILLAGEELHGPSPAIGVVFQDPRLFPWLDVLHNVAFGLSRRLPWRERRELALRACERVGLGTAAEALPKQLSGGMAQRPALARALVARPPVLLLDEPFSALDAVLRAQLQAELLRLWGEDRPTLLLVTHDLDEAVLLADEVVVLGGRPGRIVSRLAITLPRPREPHGPAFQMLRARLLSALPSSNLQAA